MNKFFSKLGIWEYCFVGFCEMLTSAIAPPYLRHSSARKAEPQRPYSGVRNVKKRSLPAPILVDALRGAPKSRFRKPDENAEMQAKRFVSLGYQMRRYGKNKAATLVAALNLYVMFSWKIKLCPECRRAQCRH